MTMIKVQRDWDVETRNEYFIIFRTPRTKLGESLSYVRSRGYRVLGCVRDGDKMRVTARYGG